MLREHFPSILFPFAMPLTAFSHDSPLLPSSLNYISLKVQCGFFWGFNFLKSSDPLQLYFPWLWEESIFFLSFFFLSTFFWEHFLIRVKVFGMSLAASVLFLCFPDVTHHTVWLFSSCPCEFPRHSSRRLRCIIFHICIFKKILDSRWDKACNICMFCNVTSSSI